MHLTIEDFENYLSIDNISPETLEVITPIQLHLDGCEQCRTVLSRLNLVYRTIADESLGSSVNLLKHETVVRRGLVFAMLYRRLHDSLPQEHDNLRKLISAFAEEKYRTYRIDKLKITPVIPRLPELFKNCEQKSAEPKTDKPQPSAPLDFTTLLKERKKDTPFQVPSGVPIPSAASTGYRPVYESYSYNYDGKELTVTATLISPALYMILMPESGLELPQLQPVIEGPGNRSYKAVFPLESPCKTYQVYIFSVDS